MPMYTLLQQEFQKNGYIFMKDFFSKAEVLNLIENIKQASAEKIGDDILDKGNLKFYALLMHRSEELRAFISQSKIVDFLKKFAGPDIWVRWDQAVEKSPGAGTFPWHQDNQYSQLKDEHFQFWISLTTMTENNGGLWVVPGSHKRRLPYDNIQNHAVYKGEAKNPVFISAEPGDVVLFSSFILHSTTPNITQESRWAYVVEYMQMDKIDPYIEGPYLVIAKDGLPHLEYLEEMSSAKTLVNRLKYNNLYDNWKQKIKAIFPI